MMNTQNWMKLINSLNLLGLSFSLLVAFVLQFALRELPCPLCLLQRIGLLAISFGFLLNVHYQIRPGHYSLSLLAAVFTGVAAMRQVVMNALPPHGYGYPELGLHLYTWVFLICIATIVYTSIILSIPGQYTSRNYSEHIQEPKSAWVRTLSHLAFAFLFLMVVGNAVSNYFECGLHTCSGDFLTYKVKLKL